MRTVTYTEKPLIMDILSRSFDNNQSVNYIIRQGAKRHERINALMAYSFDVCYLFGEIFLSDDNRGCALLLYPEKKKTTLKSVKLDIQLVFNCIGLQNIGKAFKREVTIKKTQRKERKCYLWFIGVHPNYQNRGTGGGLMSEIIEHSKGEGLPLYLETSTRSNLPFYEKYGFKIYNELDLSYKLFFLKRDP